MRGLVSPDENVANLTAICFGKFYSTCPRRITAIWVVAIAADTYADAVQ